MKEYIQWFAVLTTTFLIFWSVFIGLILIADKATSYTETPCVLPRNDAQMLNGYEAIPQI